MQRDDSKEGILKEPEDDGYLDVAATIRVIGGKWKVILLWQICGGHIRFNELRRLLPGVSQKMLSQHLRELEQDGVIIRHVYPDTPPKVEYSLSEYGHSLEPVFESLCGWGRAHRHRMEEKEKVDFCEK